MKAIYEFTTDEGRVSYTFKRGTSPELEDYICSLMGTREARVIYEGSPEFEKICSDFKKVKGELPCFTSVPVRRTSRSGSGLEL